MRFKQYLAEGKDIFGFDKEFGHEPKKYLVSDEMPIDPIDSEIFLGELNRLKLGTKRPLWDWHNKVQWGKSVGAMQVDVSPIGSSKVIVRRLTSDLEGEPVWICKKVVRLNDVGVNKNEISVAYNLYNTLNEIDRQLIDAPERRFDELKRVAQSLSAYVRQKAPEIFIYEGAKELADNYFVIYFSYRGGGAGGGIKAEQFNIQLTYDPRRGLIRSWGNEVVSPGGCSRSWELNPSEWDELFTPSQPIEEIIEAITTAFSTY